MFSWFTSPALNTQPAAPTEEDAVDAARAPLSVEPGFHPIVLPTPREVSAVSAGSVHPTHTPYVEQTNENNRTTHDGDLFGGLEVSSRSTRRRARARRSPSSLSLGPDVHCIATETHRGALSEPGLETPSTGTELPLPSADAPHSRSLFSAPPSAASAFAFLTTDPHVDASIAPQAGAPAAPQNSAAKLSTSPVVPAGPGNVDEVRRRLERFYREHNPAKLPDVDATATRFASREEELFAALVKKYGPEPGSLDEHALSVVRDSAQGGECGTTVGEPSTSSQQHQRRLSGGSSESEHCFVGSESRPPCRSVDGGDEGETCALEKQSATVSLDAIDVRDTLPQVEAPLSPKTTNSEHQAHNSTSTIISSLLSERKEEATAKSGAPETLTGKRQDSSLQGDDAYPSHSKHEVDDLDADVASATSRFGASLRAIASVVTFRSEVVARIRATREQMEKCATSERFEEADIASHAMARWTAKLRDIDEEVAARTNALPALRRDLEKRMLRLARYLSSSKAGIENEAAAEAQRLQANLDDIARQWEAANDLQGDIDRAMEEEECNCKTQSDKLRAQQELIEDDICHTTHEAHAQKEAVEGDIARLDEEIEQLESRLSALRTQRDDKRNQTLKLSAAIAEARLPHQKTLEHLGQQLKDVCSRIAASQREAHLARTQAQQTKLSLEKRRDSLARELAKAGKGSEEATILGRRARQLEEGQVPLVGVATETLVSLLQHRQRGLAGSALTMVLEDAGGYDAEKERKCTALETKLVSLSARERAVSLSLCNLRESLPALEAAKAAAVAAKQFKVARLRSNEVTEATDSIQAYEAELRQLAPLISDTQAELEDSRAVLNDQRTQAQDKARAFVRDYRCELEEGVAICTDMIDGGVHSDAAVAQRSLSGAAFPSDTVVSNAFPATLEEAFHTVWSALSAELEATSEKLVVSDKEAIVDKCDGETPEEEAHTLMPQATALKEKSRSSTTPTRQTLCDLETALAEALAREDYEACETLQAQIDTLQEP